MPNHPLGKRLFRQSPAAARARYGHRLGRALSAEQAGRAATSVAAMPGAGDPRAIARPARGLGISGEFGDRGGKRRERGVEVIRHVKAP